jgi:hypothetical protein
VQNQKTKQFLNIKNKYLQVSLKCLIAAVKCFTAAAKYKPNERCCQGLAAKLPLRLVFFSSSFLTVTQECKKETLSVFLLFFSTASLLCFSCLSFPILSPVLSFSLIFLLPFFCYFSALFLSPLARSLEGFIYSLEYLYLGKI